MRLLLVFLLTTTLVLNSACGSATRHSASGTQPHHRGDAGFQNNYISFQPRDLMATLVWTWQAMLDGIPRPPKVATPQVPPELGFIRANAVAGAAMQPTVTWIGHATALVQIGGLNVLTDPIFSDRASPLGFVGPRRAQPPGIALEDLPHIDVVVISHDHYDHLDAASVQALSEQPGGSPRFLVGLGNKAWFAEQDIGNVREMDWWDSEHVGAVEFVMTPVQHWSGRGLGDRMQTLWGGWAMFAPEASVFHAGDSGYSNDFADIAARLAPQLGAVGFDLALIPIGAYAPRRSMRRQHVNPGESIRMHRDLRARQSLGIHWGTFDLADEPLDEPPRALARERKAAGLSDDDFFLLSIGETRRLAPRPAVAAATPAGAAVTQSP